MSKPKIIYDNESDVKFSDLEVGETFTSGRNLFMKIDYIEIKDLGGLNAVVLSNGSLTYVMDTADVTPVDVEINVK